jgi:lipopolysaccharide biosynthesis glycosyltransferase
LYRGGCQGTIDIVTACDNGYAQHAHVFVESLLSTNTENAFRVFILVPEGFRHTERLSELEHHANVELHFIQIGAALVDDLHVSEHITPAAYFRLLIGDVLPAHLQRVLYFDSDIIVAGDVLPLWQADLAENIVGAVADATPDQAQERTRRIVLTGAKTYFNSGVMLIDLTRWRAESIARKALKFCRENPERLRYWDQCALNFVLAGSVLNLSAIWNLQNWHVGNAVCGDDARKLMHSARIVHFTALKPWFYRCRHPFANRYWEFLRRTPWRDFVPPDRTALNIAQRQLRRFLPDWLVRSARPVLDGMLRLPMRVAAFHARPTGPVVGPLPKNRWISAESD